MLSSDREDPRILPRMAIPEFTTEPRKVSPGNVLNDMANTYHERKEIYGDNWENVGQVMMSFFPDGMHLETPEAFNQWHLFELIVVKLTRFANTKLTHVDSIHDIAVYAAMIESTLRNQEQK